MLLFGVVGYLLRKLDYPVAPAVLAIVLGPLAENSFRQSMLASQGDMSVFVQRPLSGLFVAIAVVLFIYPIVMNAVRRKRQLAATRAD
jgi:putative tricarboxylic transport membrane protein